MPDYKQDTLLRHMNDAYNKILPTPRHELIAAALLGGAAGLGIQTLFSGTGRALARPFYSSSAQFQQDQKKQTARKIQRKIIASILGAAGLGGLSIIKNYKSYWNKNASLADASVGYGFDPGTTLSTMRANALMTDPALKQLDPYASNLGTSIVNAAANGNRTTTLGSIYDSSVNKMQTKFKFDGIGNTAMKAGMSYAVSNLFTTALGGMLGLPQNVQNNIISAGTWAGTISSILN